MIVALFVVAVILTVIACVIGFIKGRGIPFSAIGCLVFVLLMFSILTNAVSEINSTDLLLERLEEEQVVFKSEAEYELLTGRTSISPELLERIQKHNQRISFMQGFPDKFFKEHCVPKAYDDIDFFNYTKYISVQT